MNPVNDYLGPFYEKIFSEFISRGWLRFMYGGADVGGYLAHHRKVDSVHMTGSAATYDAIVWGTDDQAATRKANNTPILDKPISAELGGVSPFIVVPGDWSDADVRFQAEQIATTKLINCGHNCNATQVLVVSQDWPLTDKLVAEVGKVMREAEPRPTYYPRSDEKTAKACNGMSGAEFVGSDRSRVLIPDVDPRSEASILRDEVFASVLGVVRLPGKTPQEFLRNAIEFSNDVLPGTLAAIVVIDPKTRKQNTATFDDAIASLRYGAIGVNVWPGCVRSGLHVLGRVPRPYSTAHRQRNRSGAQRLPAAAPAEGRRRDPVSPVTAFHPQRRADALAEADVLHHQQDRRDDDSSTGQVPRRRQPLALPGIFASALRG